MNTELASLVTLQEEDLELDRLRKSCDAIGPQIDALALELQNSGIDLERFKNGLTQLLLKKKELEMDMSAKEEEIKKFQKEVNNVKTNEAYKAILKELDQAKTKERELEDNLLDVLQRLEDHQKELKGKEGEFKTKEQDTKGRIGELEKKREDMTHQVHEKSETRNSFAASVPEKLKTRYDSIRKGKGGVAVVPIQGIACGGCRFNLPPHVLNDVAKDQTIVTCESCARILYLSTSPSPSQAA